METFKSKETKEKEKEPMPNFLSAVRHEQKIQEAVRHALISTVIFEIPGRHLSSEDTKELLTKLKGNGFKLGLILSDHDDSAHAYDKSLTSLFDSVISSEVVVISNSHKGLHHRMLDELDSVAEESLFVHGSTAGFSTAKKHGMKALLFKDGTQLKTDLVAMGVKL